MINQEIRGNLARLLATENLVVEHRKVATACFDVIRRVLTLPMWDKASNVVYDLLVGHEVGHALFTPPDLWDADIPKDFINVVEDARIEKLMKRKHAGLNKDFYNGYRELNEQDFFDIVDQDLSQFNLIDRINLHFKIGAYACIPFSTEEQVYVDKVSKVETFKEVIDLCRELKDYLNQSTQDIESIGMPQSSENGEEIDSDETQSESSSIEQPCDTNDDSSDIGSNEIDDESPVQGKQGGDKYESQTQKAFDEAAEELTNQRSYGTEPVYVEVPKVNLDKVIVNYDRLQNYISKYWKDLNESRAEHWGDIFDQVDTDYKEYKKASQKEVNYLVKEFECRKSADAYARAGQSKTGVLDTAKLHTYKYNEDLFKKVTVLPDGKNHGMIFVLDWSGSMGTVLMDTVKQLINLCWFCRKVQIPFEVYSFTYEWNENILLCEEDEVIPQDYSYERRHNSLSVHKRFHLLNLVTSRSNSSSFDTSLKHLYRLANYYTNNATYYHNPLGLDLSGTPLNESLISLKTIIPDFQQKNDVQKVNVCILTDGEANNISYDVDIDSHMGNRSVQQNCCLRDRKLGRTYRHFDWESNNSITSILLENLKDNFPQVNFIGFRIGSGNDFSTLYKSIHGWKHDHDVIMKQWRKIKSWELNGLGYDSLYVLGQTTLSSDVEFDVEQGAKKTAISKSFRSMLKAKTTNKKILASFATVIS